MPFLLFELEFPVPKERIVKALNSSVSKGSMLDIHKGRKPFVGAISKDKFKIMRKIKRLNSFNPILYGHFISSIQGSRIRVLMTFHPLIWFMIAVFALFFPEPPILNTHHLKKILEIFFRFFLLFVGTPFFIFEASKSKKLLLKPLRF